jgi:hypothetical protein
MDSNDKVLRSIKQAISKCLASSPDSTPAAIYNATGLLVHIDCARPTRPARPEYISPSPVDVKALRDAEFRRIGY